MLERVERLLKSLDQRKPLDDDLSSWLTQAFRRHIETGVDLGAALNIGGCRAEFLRARRDYCIERAWRILEREEPGGSHWARSGRLKDLIKRFHAGRWQHLELKPEPESMDDLSRWILRSLKTGQGLIGQRRIDDILKNNDGSNFNQIVVNFYHWNQFYRSNMTEQKSNPKRVTDEMARDIWAKRHRLTENWKQREREAAAEEMRRRVSL
ncbi:hypothetical protein [Methylotuvimicrobium sp. KM1]|uniref:hypothetical protein n=1 Tax=Methylotuvimicrobium sp. KM1 TaxID=3377707 RepID=UPI00384B15AA